MNKTKILYIDSHKSYSKKLLTYLIDNHYCVKYIDSITEAFIEYSFNKPDIIIIDISLKDGSGLEFIEEIKNQNNKEIVIILTKEIEQKLFSKILSIKIDKLIFKDSSFESIKRDIDTLSPVVDDNIDETLFFNLGDNYFYEKEQRRVINDNLIIQLTPQEDSLIYELIKAQGLFVDIERLQMVIAKDEISSIDTLRTVIRKIRKKTYPDIIENQSGIGYRINVQNDIDIQTRFSIKMHLKLDIKILILSGNKYKSDSLNYQLEKLGFSCECVNTIDDAKIILSHTQFDYVISELTLPDGDGADFIKEINSTKCTKVIILSNNSDMHYKEYLYFRGVIDYIVDIDNIPYLAFNIYKTIIKIENNIEFNKILVIEKSKKICEQIKDILQPRNYNISVVNDLDLAYKLLKREKYALVILDVSYKDSYKFLSDTKENIDKDLPFITLTDNNREYNIVRDSFKNGASDALRKPIFAEEFILKVDKIIDYFKTIQEITQQKELLRAYKNIVDITAIVSKTNPKGIITYVNDMFCKLSQYSKEELIGKSHNIIRDPSMSKEFFRDMWSSIKNKKIWRGVIKNRAKDGSQYIVDTAIMPIFDINGEIEEYIALRTDITSLYKEETDE